MVLTEYMWECICGYKEYGEEEPEECVQCKSTDSFMISGNMTDETESDETDNFLPSSVQKSKSRRMPR